MPQKINSKLYIVSCSNTHHDVTDLVNRGMVQNIKFRISWELNITFLRNKKILNLCLRWYILRSYRFVTEVTLNLGMVREHWHWKMYRKHVDRKAIIRLEKLRKAAELELFRDSLTWLSCNFWSALISLLLVLDFRMFVEIIRSLKTCWQRTWCLENERTVRWCN